MHDGLGSRKMGGEQVRWLRSNMMLMTVQVVVKQKNMFSRMTNKREYVMRTGKGSLEVWSPDKWTGDERLRVASVRFYVSMETLRNCCTSPKINPTLATSINIFKKILLVKSSPQACFE